MNGNWIGTLIALASLGGGYAYTQRQEPPAQEELRELRSARDVDLVRLGQGGACACLHEVEQKPAKGDACSPKAKWDECEDECPPKAQWDDCEDECPPKAQWDDCEDECPPKPKWDDCEDDCPPKAKWDDCEDECPPKPKAKWVQR